MDHDGMSHSPHRQAVPALIIYAVGEMPICPLHLQIQSTGPVFFFKLTGSLYGIIATCEMLRMYIYTDFMISFLLYQTSDYEKQNNDFR